MLVSHNDILARPEAISTHGSLHCTSDTIMGEIFSGKQSTSSQEDFSAGTKCGCFKGLFFLSLVPFAAFFLVWGHNVPAQLPHPTDKIQLKGNSCVSLHIGGP